MGKAIPRIDALERVTGRARYAADHRIEGMLFGRVVMAHVPHAEIEEIDVSEAAKLEGVKAIITAKDCLVRWGSGERFKTRYAMAEKVRFAGEVIAAVAAVDRATAKKAASLIRPTYKSLPTILSARDALSLDVPRIWPDGNLQAEFEHSRGDVREGFRDSDLILEMTYKTPRQHPAPLETASSLAWWRGDKLTVITTTQGVSNCREELARDLGLPAENVRVICKYKGGGFGNKNNCLNYDIIAAMLSKRAGAPVLVEYDRLEDFVGMHSRWSTEQRYRIGLKKGKVNALEVEALCDIGAYGRHTREYVEGPERLYPIPNMKLRVKAVYTNKPTSGNMRGPAWVPGYFALETAIDEAAYEAGTDPLSFRTTNLGDEITSRYTSCGLLECIRIGAEKIGWAEKWHRPGDTEVIDGHKKRGIGMAIADFHARLGRGEAELTIETDGKVELRVGVVDIGTGAKTAMAIIAAEALGVEPSDINVIWGDTEECPYSIGESGSRTTAFTGTAVREAALKAKERLLERASEMLEERKEELEIEGGYVFSRRNPEVRESFKSVASSLKEKIKYFASTDPQLPRGVERSSFAAHFAEVEVDLETGMVEVKRYVAVHDSGPIVNLTAARSQVLGGVTMGLSLALHEEYVVDGSGNVLSNNFWNYRVQRIVGIPDIDVTFVETNDPYGPKPLGEITCIPVPPAIGNAIYNATGARLREIPFRPDRVLSAICPKTV